MSSVPNMAVVDSRQAMLEDSVLLTLPMIKVSIVEDDAKLRETLVRYFAGQPGFRCLKAYPNAEAALASAEANAAAAKVATRRPRPP